MHLLLTRDLEQARNCSCSCSELPCREKTIAHRSRYFGQHCSEETPSLIKKSAPQAMLFLQIPVAGFLNQLSSFTKFLQLSGPRKRNVQHRWLIRLWFLIESIICCGMCPFRLPSHSPKVHSSMINSIQDFSSKLLLSIFVVFGFIDSFTHDAFLYIFSRSHQAHCLLARKRAVGKNRELEFFPSFLD